MLKKWDELPDYMKCLEVKEYYDVISKKKASLFLKKIFDIIFSILMITILFIPMLLISIFIFLDSPGGVFYRQERVTFYGKKFMIYKFRTMFKDSDKFGHQITINNDMRITKLGKFLRKYRLDEIPQIFNVLFGTMSFVGTRPETTKFVKKYTKEMYATLLLPAGITSYASIKFKNEEKLLDEVFDIDETYINFILPEKMKYNLESIKKFSFINDIKIIFLTFLEVFINK